MQHFVHESRREDPLFGQYGIRVASLPSHVTLARGAARICASVELRHTSKYRFGRWFLAGIGHFGAGESTPQQHLFGGVTQVGRERFEVIEPKPNQTVLKTRQLLF
jgi:hypothetical protein